MIWGMHLQAFLIEHDEDTVDFVGNRTDCALLMLLRSWGVSYEALREVRSGVVDVCSCMLSGKSCELTRSAGNVAWPDWTAFCICAVPSLS